MTGPQGHALQATDSLIARPWTAQRSVQVGLLVPWVVGLLGYAVYGVGGAASGIMVAVFGLALLDRLEAAVARVGDPMGEPSGSPVPPALS
jgi:hypothetical protein